MSISSLDPSRPHTPKNVSGLYNCSALPIRGVVMSLDGSFRGRLERILTMGRDGMSLQVSGHKNRLRIDELKDFIEQEIFLLFAVNENPLVAQSAKLLKIEPLAGSGVVRLGLSFGNDTRNQIEGFLSKLEMTEIGLQNKQSPTTAEVIDEALALEDGFLFLYQPIFDAKREIIGYEVLTRLRYHPQIRADHIFECISKQGKSAEFTKKMISQTLPVFRRFRENSGKENLTISFNITASELSWSFLISLKEEFMRQRIPVSNLKIEAGKIVFEVLEVQRDELEELPREEIDIEFFRRNFGLLKILQTLGFEFSADDLRVDEQNPFNDYYLMHALARSETILRRGKIDRSVIKKFLKGEREPLHETLLLFEHLNTEKEPIFLTCEGIESADQVEIFEEYLRDSVQDDRIRFLYQGFGLGVPDPELHLDSTAYLTKTDNQLGLKTKDGYLDSRRSLILRHILNFPGLRLTPKEEMNRWMF